MSQMTVFDLYNECIRQVSRGNGDKKVVISDDNEGNSFHGLFFGFTKWSEDFKDYIYDSTANSNDDTIILG